MNTEIIVPLILLIVGLLFMFGLGWFLGRRSAPVADGRVELELRAQVSNLRDELQRANAARLTAEKGLASTQAQVESARAAVAEMRQQHADQLAAFRAESERSLAQMREAFGALSQETLSKLQPQFLTLANETLAKHAEVAKGDLAQRQEAIGSMLKPVEELLRAHQERLADSEVKQATAIGEVSRHLATLAEQSTSLSGETAQLRRVLSAGSARGRWGEQSLRRVCEASGMSVHCDFAEQSSQDEGRPDLIVKLPGDRVIVVDSKVPDFDFLNALNESDEVKRKDALKAHADKLRGTIRDLAARDYPNQFPNALDHVVLFLPAESLFSAALEGDSELLVWAAQRRIMLATPASLIALLRSVAMSWQQHDQAQNAKEIAAQAEELFSRVATFVKHFDGMRSGLAKVNEAFNDAVGSYERSVRPQGERVLKLGVGSGGKQLPEIVPVADSLRLPPSPRSAS